MRQSQGAAVRNRWARQRTMVVRRPWEDWMGVVPVLSSTKQPVP